MKLFKFLIIILLYLFVLIGVNYLHMKFFKVDVVFYASIFDALLATAICFAAVWFFSYFDFFSSFEKIEIVFIFLLIGYSFAISVPTVVDRSLSFYILEKIQQRGGGILESQIKNVFINEYLPEYRLVDVRLTEQLESGTITIKNGCVKLTPKGEMVANFGAFYRENVLPKKRLLMGDYTDALTDPFSNSLNDVGYQCK